MRFGRGRLDPPVGVVGHDELADLAAFAREGQRHFERRPPAVRLAAEECPLFAHPRRVTERNWRDSTVPSSTAF